MYFYLKFVRVLLYELAIGSFVIYKSFSPLLVPLKEES